MSTELELFEITQGIGIIAYPAQPCPHCDRMTHFFQNIQGQTYCANCAPDCAELRHNKEAA